MNNKIRINNSLGEVIFDIFNYLFLIIFSLVSILPFLNILASSFTNDAEIRSRSFFIIPHHITLDAFKYVFSSNTIMNSIFISIFVTLIGTFINLLFTVTMAYPLSRKNLMGRSFILNSVIFTMVFSGGMIPTYLVIKSLHLINSYWSLWLPSAIGAMNLIIVKNFFEEMPQDLREAATIDGCTEVQILFKIILPLAKPMVATFALFYAVSHWNNFMGPLLYINDSEKWPFQIILRQLIILSRTATQLDETQIAAPQESMKMAVIVVGMLPIMLVYPFLQKYFAKGVMTGAIKG